MSKPFDETIFDFDEREIKITIGTQDFSNAGMYDFKLTLSLEQED